MMSNRDEQQLERLLERWKVEAAPSADLAPRVWRRLAESGEPEWHFRPLEWLSGFSEGFLLRPAAAAALLAVALLGGIGVAEWRLSRQEPPDPAQWERVYLTSINPVAQAAGATHTHHHGPGR